MPPTSAVNYDFLIALKGDENLFVVNQGLQPLPLTKLSITSDKGNILSDVWDIVALEQGECVAWGRKADVKFPEGVECTLLKHYDGDYEGKAFWADADFDIAYGETVMERCKKKEVLCPVYFVSGEVELPQRYKLVIKYQAREGIFIMNQNDDGFPLTFLRLSNDKGAVTGEDWGIDRLEPGSCLVAWKDDKEVKAPDGLDCVNIDEPLLFEKGRRFWESKFTIAYGNETLGECEEKDKICVFEP
jgi:hypothetical protein